MKISANREGMQTAFTLVASVINNRSPKPILKNVKFNPASKTLFATDNEIGFSYCVSGLETNGAYDSNMNAEGTYLLPISFAQILRELDDERIDISFEGTQAIVKGAASKFSMATASADEFPVMPSVKGSEHKIKAGDLSVLIRRTIIAVATENSRYALSSCLLEFDQGVARMVGTDGKKLALMEMPGTGKSEHVTLLSPKSLGIIQKILIDPESEITVTLSRDAATFASEKATVWTRLVEGRYPRYRDVMPPKKNYSVQVDVGAFSKALRQARIFTTEATRGVEFEFTRSALSLTSQAEDGASEISMPISFDGDPLTITFDPRFVLDAMRVIDDDAEVWVDLIDGRRAVVLRTGDYRFVVMPLNAQKVHE